MRKVSDHMRLVKREAGANPARTRHRDSQATAYYHWETGKGAEASERSVGRPAFRSTGMKSYRSPATFAKPASSTLSAASQLIFAYKTVRVNSNNENSCHEKLAVRNLQNQKHFWFYFVALRDSKLWLRAMELIQQSEPIPKEELMKKKLIVLMLSMSMTAALVSGCGSTAETAVESTATETVQETATEAETADAESDQEAADKVAALIDQIYVQERNDNTDEQCAEAKAAWDALTDAQKELVEGENADPDYFGRDTGDASKDDPLNADEIGENELLVVSFGTSFNDSRAEDIGGIEKALQKAYPDWSVRRAFTAQIIINHVQARDGEKIDNMDQALQRAVDNGVKNLIVQPTHLMHGAEYDELSEAVASYSDKFESVSIAEPLLGEVGSADDSVNSDKEAVAKAVTAEAVKTAGYESLDAAKEDGTAFVFMGHGTSHTAKISYSQMQNQMNALGYDNVFIGTVEGEPEDTACEAVIEKIQEAGYKKVILRPLMVVAGDHANNDMAGDDDDSWKSQFEASGVFDSIETQIAGLGQIPVIQDLYVSHTHAAMEELGTSAASNSDTTDAVLEDGTYEAEFKTDSGMFHVNEANDGKGVLTVKDGQMSIHISLTSKNIVNLFVGKAADAKKDGAELLQPTTDTVTYYDGTTEEVNGFDVPVKALDKDFDLALIGTKGKWYDHTVSVTNPVKVD